MAWADWSWAATVTNPKKPMRGIDEEMEEPSEFT
jgi:hypothetical protein